MTDDRRAHVPGRLATAAILLLGIGVPIWLGLYFVYAYGVNLPIHDEWSFMPTVRAFYERGEWLSMVFEHYGEHRIVVPKILILLLSTFTSLDVKAEMYLSASLMGLTLVLCWFLLRRTEEAPAWMIVPIGFVLMSWGQFANFLVGWQFQIPLMNVLAVLAVILVTGCRSSVWRWALAMVCAFVASFCFANGMLIWPSVLAVILLRPEGRLRTVPVWIAAMVATLVLYRWGYEGYDRVPQGYESAFLANPAGVAGLFFGMLGNNLGAGRAMESIVVGAVTAVLVVAALHYLLVRVVRKSGEGDRPGRFGGLSKLRLARNESGRLVAEPWLALLCFSTLSAASIAVGRGFLWKAAVTRSQYVTITIFVPVAGLVLVGMAARRLLRRHPSTARRWLPAAGLILLVVGSWQLHRTMQVGLAVAKANHRLKVDTIPCVLGYRTAPVECLDRLYAIGGERVRERAETLERWGLGPFAHASELGAPELAARGGFDQIVIEPGTDPPGEPGAESDAGGVLMARGWALNDDLSAPDAVILAIDGEWRSATSRFLERPDVASYFRRAFPIPPSGWRITIPLDQLSPGPHMASVLILPAGAEQPIALGVDRPFEVPGAEASGPESLPRVARATP